MPASPPSRQVAFPVIPPGTPECKNWLPEEEECRCSCRCVCIYSPSGRVYWMPSAPPPMEPKAL
jgi:hypothetical protein